MGIMVNTEEERGRNGNGEQKFTWRVQPLVFSNMGQKLCEIKLLPLYKFPNLFIP